MDVIRDAQRHGDADGRSQVMLDVEVSANIRARRIMEMSRIGGNSVAIGISFILSTLAMLGFYYGVEFAQALFLIAFPYVFVVLHMVKTARRLTTNRPTGADMIAVLLGHRAVVQIIGIFGLFFAIMWGMFTLLTTVAIG
ncbi:MAG: hypothetical protein ACPGVK_07375 [Halocynthiibacter sp.]